jgi:phosphohistidine phosphatase
MKHRRLLLMRHAKSAWDKPGASDVERALAPRGRRAAAAMGVFIRDEGLTPDLVLCSAARRARETWAGIAQVLDKAPPMRQRGDLYMATAGTLLKQAQAVDDDVAALLFIGHEGGVDELARQIVGGGDRVQRKRLADRFPTASLAVIAVTLAHWADLGPQCGTLTRFVAPKELV